MEPAIISMASANVSQVSLGSFARIPVHKELMGEDAWENVTVQITQR